MIYLASPYSHPSADVRKQRYLDALEAALLLFRLGELCYSPIVYSHQLHLAGLAGEWNYWKEMDGAMISACSRFAVLQLPGWDESVGVAAEIDLATALGRTVEHLSLEDLKCRL